MYYRMTRFHFEEDSFPALVEWAESIRGRIEAIDGLVFADLIRGGATDGMVIAAYQNEEGYQAASDLVATLLDEMTTHLTAAPHGHDGTVIVSYGR